MSIEVDKSTNTSQYWKEHHNPTHYEITFKIDTKLKLLEGRVLIFIDIMKDTKEIRLHVGDQEITNVEIWMNGTCGMEELKEELKDLNKEDDEFTMDLDRNKLSNVTFTRILDHYAVLSTSSELRKGFRVIVDLQFKTYFSKNGSYRGLFESVCSNGQHILLTHLEPCDARTVFPCMDFPSLKATFRLTTFLDVKKDVISNTLPEKVEILNDMKRITFKKTPLMSPYLFTFVVGSFDCHERILQVKGKEIKLRGFVPKGLSSNISQEMKFSLSIAEQSLEFYWKKFNFPYMLEKLDLIGVPFLEALAMENFGAIIFRLSYLLVNQTTQLRRKQRITRLICHEVGHQWFGNLVSIPDWRFIWLKEGMARFLEYYLVDNFFPEWNFFDDFISTVYSNCIVNDEQQNLSPVEIQKPNLDGDLVKTFFNSISYGKGACILRMLFACISENSLWNGLQEYMNRFQYGTATSDDLIECFAKFSDVDVTTMMNCWIRKVGHPMIVIDDEITDGVTKYSIQQFQCTDDYKHKFDVEAVPTMFYIPLFTKSIYQDGKVEYQTCYFDQKMSTISMPTSNIRIFNANHSGFYRTKYSNRMYLTIIENIEKFSEREIIGFVIDLMYFMYLPTNHPGNVNLSFALRFMKVCKKYSSNHFWIHIFSKLQTVCYKAKSQCWSKKLHEFIVELSDSLLKASK